MTHRGYWRYFNLRVSQDQQLTVLQIFDNTRVAAENSANNKNVFMQNLICPGMKPIDYQQRLDFVIYFWLKAEENHMKIVIHSSIMSNKAN